MSANFVGNNQTNELKTSFNCKHLDRPEGLILQVVIVHPQKKLLLRKNVRIEKAFEW